MADVKVDLAAEAVNIVSGARRAAYGKPEQNFERIARLWNAHIANTGRRLVKSGSTFGDPEPLTAVDVATFCRFIKEARLAETPAHRDSFVDIVGYALCQAELALPADIYAAVAQKLKAEQQRVDRTWADAAVEDHRKSIVEFAKQGAPPPIHVLPLHPEGARFVAVRPFAWPPKPGDIVPVRDNESMTAALIRHHAEYARQNMSADTRPSEMA